MVDNQQFISFCYFLFLQITFINTKSQFFALQNDKIIKITNFHHNIDEVMEILLRVERVENHAPTWIKESDNFDFTIDIEAE
jgi:hypothetical protein